jgi:hypothetical protein
MRSCAAVLRRPDGDDSDVARLVGISLVNLKRGRQCQAAVHDDEGLTRAENVVTSESS